MNPETLSFILKIVYVIFVLITAVAITKSIINDQSDNISDIAQAGMIGLMVGIFWPLVWLGAFIGLIAKSVMKSSKKR